MALTHVINNVPKTSIINITRSFSLFPSLRLKQINEVRNGKELTISAEYIPSGREPYLVKHEHTKACRLCSSEIDLKHTDVLILSQYLRSDGCMLPKKVTGLCNRQQKRVTLLVAMAHKAGLMPNINPANSKKDPHKRFGWKKCNKYFDEDTLPRKYY